MVHQSWRIFRIVEEPSTRMRDRQGDAPQLQNPRTSSPAPGNRSNQLELQPGTRRRTGVLLAVRGRIPTFDAAIFADTGWEPANVYRQLARLTRIAGQAGIPVVRVSNGHIRKDALDSAHRFASMPLFILGPNGERGMARRQCLHPH
jgi:hypothetical protein